MYGDGKHGWGSDVVTPAAGGAGVVKTHSGETRLAATVDPDSTTCGRD